MRVASRVLALICTPPLNHPASISYTRKSLLVHSAAAASLLATTPSTNKASAAEAAASELPRGTVMLRVAEVTDYQETMLRQVAAASDEENARRGLSLGRKQMVMSTEVLLKNTRLGQLQGCAAAALTIGGVKAIAEGGDGKMSRDELLRMAAQYRTAREELRVAFEALPAAEQADAKAIARRLRTEDDARIGQGMEEQRQAGSTTQDLQRALYQR